jgi:hypothetical protein
LAHDENAGGSSPLPERISSDELGALLHEWQHPYGARWLLEKVKAAELVFSGDPPSVSGRDVWRRLLEDECKKLYNQAWCAYEQIKQADDPDSVAMLGIDDLPSAVEQAWDVAPELAGEHLGLLREFREAKYQDFLRSLRVGTEREAEERIAALAFWEENAEIMTEFRRTLYRIVREGLVNENQRSSR